MNIVQKFKIDIFNSIKILIPNFKDKFNYYYQPTKKLHMFDEVTVVFEEKGKQINLIVDNVNIILHKFKEGLECTLNNQILLPDNIKIGELGKYFNIYTDNEEFNKINYSLFWLWSGIDVQTWLYNKNNKIYLEISPTYPWLFSDETEEEGYITFDEFMKTYKPITVEEINHATARQWLDQCNDILAKTIKV